MADDNYDYNYDYETTNDDADSNKAAYLALASSLNGQLFLLLFISIIMGLGKGGVPGFATIATALTVTTAPVDITGGLGYAVALQVPVLTMIDVSSAWLHGSDLDWPTVWLLLPFSFVGMVVGVWMDQYMDDAAARIMVGVVLLVILVVKVKDDLLECVRSFLGRGTEEYRGGLVDDVDDGIVEKPLGMAAVDDGDGGVESSKPSSDDMGDMETYGWAGVVGLFGGMATMLTNSMGPILNVYLLSVRHLPPTSYVGTRGMFGVFLNVGKLPLRFLSGTLDWSMIPLALGLGTLSVVGVFCAKPIMLSIPERIFVRLELLVVAFAGVRLVYKGLNP